MGAEDIERSLESALEDARAALSAAEGRRAEMEIKVQSLRTEVAGLEAAIERRKHSDASKPDTPLVRATNSNPFVAPALPDGSAAAGVAALVLLMMGLHTNWTNKKRAAAVDSVLKVAGRPVHRSEIVEALKRLGRSDTLESVSAALAHLNRSARAHPVGDGFWTATILQVSGTMREVK